MRRAALLVEYANVKLYVLGSHLPELMKDFVQIQGPIP